ncbi:MAG: hypothetical protein N2Z80_07675 [Hydrogenothermaceae bacterium]|nr:hypothetical protein [Hydrogenothermaceae bacterium]
MIKLLSMIVYFVSLSFAADIPPLPSTGKLPDLGPFTGLETTVGYIQKENGEKFLILETPEGTKLMKVKKEPKKMLDSRDGLVR